MEHANTTRTWSIGLDIVLTAPMHISALEKGRYDPKTQRVHRFDAKTGLACSLTRTWEVEARRTVDGKDGEAKEFSYRLLPTIPSGTQGGRLRRCGAELIEDSVVAREMKLSTEAFNTLHAGTARAELQRSMATTALVHAAKRDAYLSVFGGTGYAFESDLIVDEGLPVVEGAEALLRFGPQTAEVSADSSKLTMVMPIVKKDDVYEMRDIGRLERVVGSEAVEKHVRAINEGRTEKNERMASGDDSGGKTELTTLATIEALRPGVHVGLRYQLRARTPAHLGFFLMCLKRMCDGGQLGGKANRGFGRFAVGSARLYSHDEKGRSLTGITIFEKTPGGIHNFSDAPIVKEAVMAGQDYVDNIDVGFIEMLAKPIKEEPKDASDDGEGGEAQEAQGAGGKKRGPKKGAKIAQAAAAAVAEGGAPESGAA